MRAPGVLVRDRSSDPGCDGRVRITIGTREQMRQAVAALNDTMAALRAGKAKRNDDESKRQSASCADQRTATVERNTTETQDRDRS